MKNRTPYSIDDLLYLMTRLRDPQTGCSWDIAQNYKSIAPSTIEEAYEVVDAIESGDFEHLREELGDFLFQVIFYSELAREEDRFNFSDIVDGLTEKLVRRHPHVFPENNLHAQFEGKRSATDEEKIKAQWETLKQLERKEKGLCGVLDDVPVALPAVQRAAKLQKRASSVGFDWDDIEPVFGKISEEVTEVREALALGQRDAIEDEIGDLLFSVVNLARHLKVEPETCLRRSNSKFERRFHFIERALTGQGRSVEDASLSELDALWRNAKESESL